MINVKENIARRAHIGSIEEYEKLYRESLDQPEEFWRRQAERLDWIEKPTNIHEFDPEAVEISWFKDGRLNASYNCIDRHVEKDGDRTAIIWAADEPGHYERISYRKLLAETSRMANVLKKHGIKAGDRVAIYLPMIPELAYTMLACARIGAVHSVVFGGFSANALADRIADCGAKMVITADMGKRGSKAIPLKVSVDEALTFDGTDCVEHVLVVKNTGDEINWVAGRDHWYAALTEVVSAEHQAKSFPAEHPLFILYTSGSTGKPKGLQHTSAGYLLYSASTFRYVFDYQEGDIYW